MSISSKSENLYTYTDIHIHTYTSMHVIYINALTRIHVYTLIYFKARIRIHVYTNTYAYVYILMCVSFSKTHVEGVGGLVQTREEENDSQEKRQPYAQHYRELQRDYG